MSFRALLISPHLDDAVLSCGAWLAVHSGCTVLTLFAGLPRDGSRSTEWDARSGFASAAAAVAGRRHEDEQALRLLDARPCWLDFTDGQYGEPADPATLAAAVRSVLQELQPDTVLLPLGLFHRDHLLAHEAAATALRGLGDGRLDVLAYEDVPYRGMPGLLQQRLAALAADGVQATPQADAPAIADADAAAAARKALALNAYPSQLRAFGADGLPDAVRPERRWRLIDAGNAAKTGRR